MAKKRRVLKSTDIISNLPDNIVEKILAHLPIKDAVKTSVLSRNWRYTWTSIPDLLFNDDDGLQSSRNESRHTLVKFIYRILLLHRGPIQKFDLCITRIQTSRAIGYWMPLLIRNDVKELKLRFFSFDPLYKLPSSLFSCQSLSSLNLYNCILKPPSSFYGFRNLKTLQLEDTTFPNENAFENMISNSPVLEQLILIKIEYPTRMKIRAPNLKYLYLNSYFSDLCFIDVPYLSHVCINLHRITSSDVRFGHQESFHFINALGCLIGIEKLEMFSYLLQFLALFNLPRSFRLPISYQRLKNLILDLDFGNWGEISVTLCLLKSAPNLQELEIHVESSEDRAIDLVEDFCKAQDQLDWCMNELNVVKISFFSGAPTELEFIKFILANSPSLNVLSVKPYLRTDIKESMVVQQLLSFQRASTKSKIEYNVCLRTAERMEAEEAHRIALEQKLVAHDQRLTTIETGMENLKNQVAQMKSMEAEIQNLKSEVARMKNLVISRMSRMSSSSELDATQPPDGTQLDD